MKEITIKDLDTVASGILKKAQKAKIKKATVLAFEGDLGTGKTTITQTICKILGVKEKIISPTFVIMKKYIIDNGKFKNLIHIDAYRLEESKELLSLGWEEIISEKENLIIIEWPEKTKEIIPTDAIKINLTHINEYTRGISF
ncbi:MAG: tRNA (adenosine(37)-N6)-threonylcarbamoyltransferase complex ATPase subunit type 1 TsaE [Candidatus Nomurabacteria bacterium]|nr:tRNA (adenosine(37)-N6)-threonylcarbamoyltransferase complex ATPase subunit type 1 TsaE [Candidatus Nomurabacteria bacterium]